MRKNKQASNWEKTKAKTQTQVKPSGGQALSPYMYIQDVTSRTGKAGPPSPILEADVSESTGTEKGSNPS